MNQKEYELIAGVLARTRIVNTLERNGVKRLAKESTLRLVTTDMAATLQHEYKNFDREKFLKAAGV